MVMHKDKKSSQDAELNRLDRLMDEPFVNETLWWNDHA